MKNDNYTRYGIFRPHPDLKMRIYLGMVLITYHRYLRALWRLDTLQVSQIQLIDMYVGLICNFNVHLNYNGCKLIRTTRSRPLFFSITQIRSIDTILSAYTK